MFSPAIDPDYRGALKQRLSGFPERALAWLVLAPEWPEELVALGFPVEDRPAAFDEGEPEAGARAVEMLRRAAATPEMAPTETPRRPHRRPRPIVEMSTAPNPWEGCTFRIAAELRTAALEQILAENANISGYAGLEYVRRQLELSAKVMQRSDKLEAYPTLWRWSQLASHAGSDEDLHSFLDAQVRTAIEAAELSNAVAVPEALRWIEAAEFFADMFQGKLELSLTLARRRRELFDRRAYDRSKLINYLPREDQLSAFHALLEDAVHWALHYVGDGGLGKTMLLRYITHHESRNPDGAISIVTSRVDFDFLNPDYPFRAPGLLLSALATELRLQAGNDATSIFISFDSSIDRLHDEATRQPGVMRLIDLDHPLFRDAIGDFASACISLGYDGRNAETRKVVLMLDTCEELAKLRPDGTVPENVRVTFEILQQVRTLADNVRVVFSGRRALASKGFGWESDSELPGRDFLRLFEVRGFSEQEASQVLANFTLDGKKIPDDFRDPILNLTRSAADDQNQRFRLFPVEASAMGDAQRRAGEARHNPYDIDMYADWAVTNPDLTVQRLREAGPHFYVEERIVGRLNPKVRSLLPQLALLGRFDRTLLQVITDSSPNAAGLCEEVIAQEWVRADRSGPVDKWLIEARLRDRILDFYRDRQWAELGEARRSLAATLIAMTLQRPFEELTVQYFGAAFEALEGDDARAALWWGQVEERILRENAWMNWGQELTQHLLAERYFDSDATTSLRSGVLATEASATVHGVGGDVGTIWQRAEAAWPSYPIGVVGRERLEFRIQCGTQALFGQVPDLTPLQHDAQCRASWLAAAETVIERAEREGARTDKFSEASLDLLCRDTDPFLRSFALSLNSRMSRVAQKGLERADRITAGPSDAAATLFQEAMRSAAGLTRQQKWLDWRAPDHPAARVELEYVRAFRGSAADVRDVASKRPFEGTIDEDRLWSALVCETEATPPAYERLSVTQRLLCNAHRQFAPLAITLAEKSARLHPVENLQVLRGYSTAAKASGLAEVSLDADRALTRVIRRQRMVSENWLIPPAVTESADPYDVWLDALTRALHTSGDALKSLVATLPKHEFPEAQPGTWQYAELALTRLDVAQLNDDSSVKELALKAKEAMQAIGDKGGLFVCHVSEENWRARTGKDLKPGIERLKALELPQSSWDEILSAAEKDDPAFLDTLQPDWRPWIARALTVCTRAARPRASQHPYHIVNWLQANHAVEDNGQRLLPLELAFLQRIPSIATRAGEFLGSAIAFVSLAVGAGASLRWLWNTTSRPSFALEAGSWDDFWSNVGRNALALSLHLGLILVALLGGFLALSAIVALVEWLLKQFNVYGWIGSPFVTEYRIEAPAEGDKNRPMASSWKAEFRSILYYVPQPWRAASIGRNAQQLLALTRKEERYRALRNFLASERKPRGSTQRAVLNLVIQLGLRPEIRISVDPNSAAGPWEVILGILSENERFSDILWRYSRTVPRRAVRAQPDWLSPVAVTTWTYSGLGVDRANFSRVQRNNSGTRRVESEILTRTSQFQEVRRRTGIVHIFGTPVERASEVFLGVGSLERGDVPYWISPPEIQRRYPSLRLLIVQAPPADAHDRTPADRLQAAQLKRFGARAFESGIPAVLVIPPLPRALVDGALSLIFDELSANGSRNASRRLIIMTRRLQEIVSAYPKDSPDLPYELAFDICLYVEGRVNFRVRPERAAAPQDPTPSKA